MKNLLLLLLLANVLYLLYNWVHEEGLEQGEILVEESQLGPQLETVRPEAELVEGSDAAEEVMIAEADQVVDDAPIVDEPGDAVVEDAGAGDEPIPADEETAEETVVADEPEIESVEEPVVEVVEDTTAEDEPRLQAVVGRICVSIGQFDRREDADRAMLQMTNDGLTGRLRSGVGQRFVGHWVQIRDIPTMDEARGMLDKLHGDGLGEAYIIETEDEGIKISIGLFGEAAGAERIELQVTALGLPAIIAPRTSQGTVHYVDLELPPGRGAGAFISQYGEDRVRINEQAVCPNAA